MNEAARARMDAWLYPGVHGHWDDEELRSWILDFLEPHHVILDLGAGAGIVKELHFKGQCAKVCGVDLDPRVAENPHLDEGKVGDGAVLPWPDATFDLVFSANVLEHLEKPAEVFAEVARVLKPGGVFLVKTPNKLHYVAIGASLTPHGFHQWFNEKRGRKSEDTFPTLYRANTPRRLRALMEGAGLREIKVDLIEKRPEYLRMTAPTYLLGAAWEKAVNHVGPLQRFRVVLLGAFRKR